MRTIATLAAAFILVAVSASAQTTEELFAALAVCKDNVTWTTTGGRTMTFTGDGARECNKIAAEFYRSSDAQREERAKAAKSRARDHIKSTADRIK